MSHIDTAYKLGALKAMEDFKAELEKEAFGTYTPGAPPPPSNKPVATGSFEELSRGSNLSGASAKTRAANPTATPTAASAPRVGSKTIR